MSKETYKEIKRKNIPIDITKYREDFYKTCAIWCPELIKHFGYDNALIYQDVLFWISKNCSNSYWNKNDKLLDQYFAERLRHKLRKYKIELRRELNNTRKQIFGDFSQEKKITYQVFDKPSKEKISINVSIIDKLHVLSNPKKEVLLGYIYNEFNHAKINYNGIYDLLNNDKVTVYDVNQLMLNLENDTKLNTKLKTLVLKINQNILAIL